MIPIASILMNYIEVVKNEEGYLGKCPFEKEGKFTIEIDSRKGSFMCPVCGVRGDAISFVMGFKRTTFFSAVDEIIPAYPL